jgi:hypothetical protein
MKNNITVKTYVFTCRDREYQVTADSYHSALRKLCMAYPENAEYGFSFLEVWND